MARKSTSISPFDLKTTHDIIIPRGTAIKRDINFERRDEFIPALDPEIEMTIRYRPESNHVDILSVTTNIGNALFKAFEIQKTE